MTKKQFGKRSGISFGLGPAVGLAIFFGTMSGAAAQGDQVGGTPTRTAVKTGVETITVQAQKREESIQSVPLSVTPITGSQIQRQFAFELTDFAGFVPNASLDVEGLSPFAASFYIRGLGISSRESFDDPAVAVVHDGVYQARASVALTDLVDVEAIEVLRGPQGTLQGRNSTAGAVLVRHHRPDVDAFAARGSLTAGRFSQIEFEGMVNVPIIENVLAIRLAARTINSSGYYFNRFDDSKIGEKNHINILPSIRLVKDNLDIVIRGEYRRTRDDSQALIPFNSCPQDPAAAIAAGVPLGVNDLFTDLVAISLGRDEAVLTCAAQPGKDSFAINQDRAFGEIEDINVWGITGTVDYDITGAGTFTYIGNYRHTDNISARDADATALDLFNAVDLQTHYQTSHELRFASDFSDFVDFIVGGMILKQRYTLRREQFLGFVAGGLPFEVESSQDNFQWGIFGQANWHLTDRITLVTGVRYTDEDKDFTHCPSSPASCALPGRTNMLEASWSNISPRVGLNYQAAEDFFLYFYWARGFRSGGFNGNAGSTAASGPYDEERIDTYEVGFKWDAFDNRLRVNGALFWMEANGLQRSVSRESAAGSVEVLTENAAGARFRGVELEVTAVPVDGLTVNGTFGYLDANYTEFCEDLNGGAPNDPSLVPCAPAMGAIQPVDVSGLPLARAPEWIARLDLTYEHDAFNAGLLAWNFQWVFEDKSLTTTGGFPSGVTTGVTNFDGSVVTPFRSATHRLNASLTWTDYDERYRVSVFVKNITDEVFLNRTSVISGLWNFVTISRPRTWGVQISLSI